MDLFKVYVATKKKNSTVVKSESITYKSKDKEGAIEGVIKLAKGLYGYKGKVHIGSVFLRTDDKKWISVK